MAPLQGPMTPRFDVTVEYITTHPSQIAGNKPAGKLVPSVEQAADVSTPATATTTVPDGGVL